MKLFRVILPVTDIERATIWYGQLLGVPNIRISPGRHYFYCEGVILALYDPISDGDSNQVAANPEHIYFSVAKLEEIHAKAVKLGAVPDMIRDYSWGERLFYCQDPYGNKLAFVDKESRLMQELSETLGPL